jgi:hypothetical protein
MLFKGFLKSQSTNPWRVILLHWSFIMENDLAARQHTFAAFLADASDQEVDDDEVEFFIGYWFWGEKGNRSHQIVCNVLTLLRNICFCLKCLEMV